MTRQSSPTSRTQLTAADKLSRAVQLRRGGATFQQIADQGIYSSAQAAHRAVMSHYRKLQAQATEGVEELRTAELDRIDALLRSLWPVATDRTADGHLYAMDRVIKLIDRRIKLLGLEAPQKHELTGGGGERLMPEGINFGSLSDEQVEVVRSMLDQAAHGSR